MMSLEGIRVLDLSRLAPGPFCTMILGDLGADITKIEGPPGGRLIQPWLTDTEETAPYSALDRNKKSLGLNLKQKEARDIFLQLAEKTDIVVEGFRPGVVKRLGVDYDTLKKINPRIIYCSITGYGQDGPYRDLPGHDINYISFGGALGMIGSQEGFPTIPSNFIGDYAAGGMNAAIGILAALVARDKTGKGQYVDIAMTDGVMTLMALDLADYYAYGKIPQRGKEVISGGVPYYNVYQTSDNKYLSIGCIEPWFYENLCRALDREDLIPYQEAEGDKKAEIFSTLKDIFRSKTRDEWVDLLSKHDVPISKVYNVDELASDPHLIERKMILELPHSSLGKIKQAGISVKLSDTPGQVRSFAPTRGQHTEEVLLDLGYDKSTIEQLGEKGAIITSHSGTAPTG